MRVQLLVAGIVGLGIAGAWGFGALAVYAFFAFIALAVVHAAAIGGDLIAAVSRSRFDYGDKPRR